MNRRITIGGILLVLMVVTTLAAGTLTTISSLKPFWLSGVFGFAAAILFLPETGWAQRIQLGLLIIVGAALMWYALTLGQAIDWSRVLAQNTGLLSMVVSVGLLNLVVQVGDVDGKLPQGRKAYLHTILSLGVLGSIINISAPILISDRLTRNRRMDMFSAAVITRTFCSCASWSPFFAGTAVVLVWVDGVTITELLTGGLPFFLIALAFLYWSAVWLHSDKLPGFHGYPMKLEALTVPAVLAVCVFIGYRAFPHLSILTVISLSAIGLTAVLLLMRHGMRQSLVRLARYVTHDMAKDVNAVQLFLSAGVLAAGLAAIVAAGVVAVPVQEFGAVYAILLLALMLVVSAMGVHPIIQIVAITPLLASANPAPGLLGLTYMFAWSLGTCASPLSGTNMVIQGRYGIVAWRLAVKNWRYVIIMFAVAAALLWIRGMSA